VLTRAIQLLLAGGAVPALAQPPVRVILDMDASEPGIQDSIRIFPENPVVPGIAVYIYDPVAGPTRSIRGVGFFGGLDRGIAIGHQIDTTNIGSVAALTGHSGTGLIPGSFNGLTGAVQKGFDGPELHYVESGPSNWPLPSAPTAPICTIDVHLANAAGGDIYRIYLLDMVTVWRGAFGGGVAGAFTTLPGEGFDSGGDSVPDGTLSVEGVDPDPAVPVPPASFLVDYIDTQNPALGGGGRIIISSGCYADCDGTGGLTASDFICFLTRYVLGHPYANCDGSTGSPLLTANDFVCFINSYRNGCS
jgi:hypothetical protein